MMYNVRLQTPRSCILNFFLFLNFFEHDLSIIVSFYTNVWMRVYIFTRGYKISKEIAL